MQEGEMGNRKIAFLWNSEVVGAVGDQKLTALRIRNIQTGEENLLPIGGMFVAIGHDPRSELFAGQLATNPEGYLLVEEPSTRTAIEGVFACGDVVDHTYRQAITAAGSGCSAAIDAERWLAETASATTDDSTDLIGAQL